MDWAQFTLQVGIGGGCLWILREYLHRADKRIDARDASYSKFVHEHNDKMSQMMVESTQAIKESTESMKKHNEVLTALINKMR